MLALVVAAGCGADLAGVVLAGAVLAVVFFAAGEVEPALAAAEDCAGKLPVGSSRQARNAATRNEVFLSSIAIHSNHWLRSGRGSPALEGHNSTVSCDQGLLRVARREGTSRGTWVALLQRVGLLWNTAVNGCIATPTTYGAGQLPVNLSSGTKVPMIDERYGGAEAPPFQSEY